RPTKILDGTGRHELDLLGMITKDMTYRTMSTKADLYVVNDLDEALLSRDANEKLEIVRKVCDVATLRTADVKPEKNVGDTPPFDYKLEFVPESNYYWLAHCPVYECPLTL
ncbi:uncharacterized protein ISCGN_024483, partial [Ixodes scapularis]